MDPAGEWRLRIIDHVRMLDGVLLPRVGRFNQERQGFRVVAEFTVAEAPELLLGHLLFQGDPLHLQVQGRHGPDLHGPLVADQHVCQPGVDGGLVHVDDDVHALLFGELEEGVADLLRQRTVGFARMVAVQVPGLRSGDLTPQWVHEDLGIRGLILHGGQPAPVAEPACLPGGCGQLEPLRSPRVTGPVVGLGGAVVGVGNDDDGPLRDRASFHQEGGGHDACDFVGVGSSEQEEGAAFGVTPHHVDGRVPGGVRQGREVVAQPARLGDAVARADVVGCWVGASATAGSGCRGPATNAMDTPRWPP